MPVSPEALHGGPIAHCVWPWRVSPCEGPLEKTRPNLYEARGISGTEGGRPASARSLSRSLCRQVGAGAPPLVRSQLPAQTLDCDPESLPLCYVILDGRLEVGLDNRPVIPPTYHGTSRLAGRQRAVGLAWCSALPSAQHERRCWGCRRC
ncbi:hypothetical protein LX32DRAFT_40360 [Colletotrichum zoysiae]|uniref:Uncharacterized protein n=1 Tax=Colletotrichum zoysiae TaxID=1216348 RepID=A0AAD9HDG8_9PEZI|nr:hypothetical protein LX32DRAFT_40360 [Colletotrichum zoysiae]